MVRHVRRRTVDQQPEAVHHLCGAIIQPQGRKGRLGKGMAGDPGGQRSVAAGAGDAMAVAVAGRAMVAVTVGTSTIRGEVGEETGGFHRRLGLRYRPRESRQLVVDKDLDTHGPRQWDPLHRVSVWPTSIP